MVGISSCGAYIPMYRLSRDLVGKAWGSGLQKGERSVANYDEDSITMAVEATFDCLQDIDHQNVDGLFFASTTSPYKEKQCSSIVVGAADLNREITTFDLANSLRAGTNALKAALETVRGGTLRNVLVTAADCRLGYPNSASEQNFGDAAAAFLISDSDVIATVEDSFSVCDDINDIWRMDGDTFVKSWEERWVLAYGYTKNMKQAISGVMKKRGLSAKDFTKAVFYAPDARSHLDLGRSLGFDTKTQLEDPLLATVGNAGAAHAMLMLVAALEEAKPGDRILLASYGDGSDAFILRVTEGIEKARKARGVKGYLTTKKMMPTYEKYLSYRQLLASPEELIRLFPAATVMWRTRNWSLSCHGSKCKRCGMVAFPIQRVCYGCQAKDEYEEVRLSDKKGKVFTFALDNLAGTPEPPVVQTIVESDEGKARIYCLMTDCDPSMVKVDMPVELTFRKIHQIGGFNNYFWKCRPIRE